MASNTTCNGLGTGVLHLVALALLASFACSSSSLRLAPGNRSDGSTGPDARADLPPPSIFDAAGELAADTAATIPARDADFADVQTEDTMDALLPLCFNGVERLSPVAAALPCTFAISAPPPCPDEVAVYLDKYLVYHGTPDGWTYGPTPSTIVFSGAACDAIISGAQDSVVQMLCSCGTVPPCPLCFL